MYVTVVHENLKSAPSFVRKLHDFSKKKILPGICKKLSNDNFQLDYKY